MSFAKLTPAGSFAVNTGSLVSMNKLSGSSFNVRSQAPHKIHFKDGWRQGAIEEWYQTQTKLSSTFKSLEYRKEKESPFFHEFIVVDLGNNSVCRFDRRGDIENRANVLIGEPIPSEDTAHVIAKSDELAYTEISTSSDLLLRMEFPKGQDLLTILAICYGIHKNKNTESYSLTRYNCYFFSWMIITATARCTVDWALLAHQESMWQSLVAAVMTNLGDDPGPGPKTVISAGPATKNKNDSRISYEFIGSAYLVNTLRRALDETREQIRISLAELILHSTVNKAMHNVSETSAQVAAKKAARSHAAQAARDAAMEAVIETMWRDIISSNDGGNLWEKKCQLAEECVRKAANAAADVEDQSHRVTIPQTPVIEAEKGGAPPTPAAEGAVPIPAPPAKWETAWDTTWGETWALGNGNTGDSDSSKANISDRAKAAWRKAWEEACKANEEYVPAISNGVAKYVTETLPEATPDVLTYNDQVDSNVIKNMVKALIPTKGSSTAQLQDWVKARIQEHCQRVFRMTAGAQQPKQIDFEDTMKVIWEATVKCLPSIAEDSEYSRNEVLRDHIGRMSKHRTGPYRQLIFPDHIIGASVPDIKPQCQQKSGFFGRRDRIRASEGNLSPSSWMSMVVEAQTFICNNYSLGDNIIILGVSGGISGDFTIVKSMITELTGQLDTSGIEISCVAHIYRNKDLGIFESNNQLLGMTPLSVRRMFNLNWEPGNESYCSTMRDSMGRIRSREACFYNADGSYLPLFMLVGSFFSNLAYADDVDTIYTRQTEFILSTTPVWNGKIQSYINTLSSDGSWSAIDYSSGCTARRSSWPAGGHWSRLLEMAVAYRGGLARYKHHAQLRSAIQKAMAYWFAHDYSTIGDGSCMDRQFLKENHCPCGTPGLWGPNWYSNVIQVPTRVGKVCVLLRSELNSAELAKCILMTARAYAPFYRNPQPGYLSGANVMDIAVIGMMAGLLENNRAGNASRIADAYRRVHLQASIQAADRVDGIKPDGSFQQHGGIIYDGNYGKDFTNSFMELELQALGTKFQADKGVQGSFGVWFDGAKWMTYTNVMSNVVHWDLTVIGRFISYPVADGRASTDLRMDLSHVLKLGKAWSQKDLIEFGSKMSGSGDNSANSGGLIGTRIFWNSDYMVHRTAETVTTVKMLSSRTTTSECVNSENPFGFHLSDGVVYTYSTGAEYEDIFAGLDYNIPPGITTDYGATKLECRTATKPGVESYAGGVQADDVGMAAMRYMNPISKSFGFYKVWFFFPNNVQHVLVSKVQQPSGSTAPVFSILDQRLRSGDVYLNGDRISNSGNFTEANTLWHGGTGYTFPPDQALATRVTVSLEIRTGDWSKVSTSKEPPYKKDMFTAWVVHTRSDGASNPYHTSELNAFPPIEYSVFPATRSSSEFENKAAGHQPRTVINSELVSAAMDSHAMILGAAFWKSSGGSFSVREMGIRVEVNRGVVLMLKFEDGGRAKGKIYVADPTHASGRVTVKITRPTQTLRQRHKGDGCFGHNCSNSQRATESRNADVTLNLDLPGGGMAGATVVKQF